MLKTIPFLFFLMISCKEASVPKQQTTFKDSIIKEYLAQIDSLEFYDTINYDFRILKAYFKNDDAFFKQMQKDVDYEGKISKLYPEYDSCVQLKKISDLDMDEVYRFKHSQSFCFYSQFVTISRKGQSIFLHYLETSSSPDGKVIELKNKNGYKKIGPGCTIEKEFNKRLNMKDWELLERFLSNADYWLLKEKQLHGCCDGSFWTIDGYTKKPKDYSGQQIQSVYRWSPQNAFADLGRIFMKIAGEKGMCGEFD